MPSDRAADPAQAGASREFAPVALARLRPARLRDAILANGRLFVNPQDNGMVYCFEPDSAASVPTTGRSQINGSQP